MGDKTRGTDLLMIGLLVWLIWKNYNPGAMGGACIPGNVPSGQSPQSTLIGPGWTRGIQ